MLLPGVFCTLTTIGRHRLAMVGRGAVVLGRYMCLHPPVVSVLAGCRVF